jgi:hypothetical protein
MQKQCTEHVKCLSAHLLEVTVIDLIVAVIIRLVITFARTIIERIFLYVYKSNV